MKKYSSGTPGDNIYISGYLLIGFFLFINTVIQIIFKRIALGPGGSDYLALLFDPLFYLCGLLFMAKTVSWLAVLRRLALSRAYPFTSLTVITIMASGAIFFGESITLGNILGICLIISGVVVIAGDNKEVEIHGRADCV